MHEVFDEFVEDLQEDILKEARQRYSAAVIDHWMHPRDWGRLDAPDGYARVTGHCGDTMEISLRVAGGRILECRYTTDGCASSIACGSMTMELIRNKDLNSLESITQEAILQALNGLPDEDQHCALLAAIVLKKAVEDYEERTTRPSED